MSISIILSILSYLVFSKNGKSTKLIKTKSKKKYHQNNKKFSISLLYLNRMKLASTLKMQKPKKKLKF